MRHQGNRLCRGLVLALVLGALVTACGNSTQHLAITVRPGTSAEDQPVRIRVTGLSPGERATVQVSSTDAVHIRWSASATYRADTAGVLDLDQAPALSGSYRGRSGTGLLWSMHPRVPDPEGVYYWHGTAPKSFTVTVTAKGARPATTTFHRSLSHTALINQSESLRADGFIGEFSRPATVSARRPAILLLGGSEGGLPFRLLAYLLASHGYPTLGVAYFHEPGLPKTLSGIPLEYFATALRWLAHQPGVDPTRMAVLGISRGSEAAQLLGVNYPMLVHAVIAAVPSDVVNPAFPAGIGPAWTLHGRGLPYTLEWEDPQPTDVPAAVIQDQRIQGPVFLVCAGNDQIWTSCPYADAIMSRLNAAHDPWPHVLYDYPHAGHYMGELYPYEPATAAFDATDPDFAADQEADGLLWPHLLHFLAALATSPRL